MTLLEEHDELGLPWDEWADGRVHRLVRGRDFARSAEALAEAAENAGRRLGRVARTVREVRYGSVIMWLQFVDYELVAGDPCGCGSANLRRINTDYVRCAACGATSYVRPLKVKPAETVVAPTGDEALLLNSLLTGPAAAKVKRPTAPAADPRTDLARLGAYLEVRLSLYSKGPSSERFSGVGTEQRSGASCLLVIDYPLHEGDRIASGAPGGYAHRAWSLPTKLFQGFVRVDELAERKVDLRIDDPLDEAAGPVDEPPSDGPALRFEELRDVTLLGRGMTQTGERYIGYGVTPTEEHLLLSLRYRIVDGERAPDPRDLEQPRYELRCVPSEPFAPFVELEELLSAPGTIRPEQGAHPPVGSAAVADGGRERKREARVRPQKEKRKQKASEDRSR